MLPVILKPSFICIHCARLPVFVHNIPAYICMLLCCTRIYIFTNLTTRISRISGNIDSFVAAFAVHHSIATPSQTKPSASSTLNICKTRVTSKEKMIGSFHLPWWSVYNLLQTTSLHASLATILPFFIVIIIILRLHGAKITTATTTTELLAVIFSSIDRNKRTEKRKSLERSIVIRMAGMHVE